MPSHPEANRAARRDRPSKDERPKSSASDKDNKMPQARLSEAERRYTPPETPRVRFPGDPDQKEDYERAERQRARERRRERDSRHHLPPSPPSSREPSRERSRSRPSSRRDSSRAPSSRRSSRGASRVSVARTPEPEEKPWFKKKTLWASVATLATVASLVPTTRAANASVRASEASQKSADASVRSARAGERSARAGERSAGAGERSAGAGEQSARAATNTTVASGHMDPLGRYTGPAKNAMIEDGRRIGGRRAIEYGGGSVRSGQSNHSGGSHGRRRH
ncbi:hypothetical protein EG328_004500 [Venturia inaequalis]|uniref:Uncharacterized protein n=3 Tax=Venturia inaequalis TaxID=5025 RepID=A0A8H3ULU7_VENIN|nr:hypothetical protein EG328_004500 [Venturia inaequalis]RDI86801.1 hypothetical protein Vi05172_g3009 [Venturia inaequalis]